VDGPRALVEADDPQAPLAAAVRRGPVHEFAPVSPTLSQLHREVRRTWRSGCSTRRR
jgi:hypothetical protein